MSLWNTNASPATPIFSKTDLCIWPWPWPWQMTLTCYKQKGLVTRYTHAKYEGPNCYQSKAMTNVKVFADKPTDKRTGQKLYAPRPIDAGA